MARSLLASPNLCLSTGDKAQSRFGRLGVRPLTKSLSTLVATCCVRLGLAQNRTRVGFVAVITSPSDQHLRLIDVGPARIVSLLVHSSFFMNRTSATSANGLQCPFLRKTPHPSKTS